MTHPIVSLACLINITFESSMVTRLLATGNFGEKPHAHSDSYLNLGGTVVKENRISNLGF
jgi:hypothetical protein